MSERQETVREVCAEMRYDYLIKPELIITRILSAHEREMAAKDAEIEAALKTQNDYHAALLTICTADKTAEGLREIAIDACNGKIAANNRVAKKCMEVK